MLQDLAHDLFGSNAETVPLPQSTSTIYATASSDSSDGTVRVVMDGMSVTQPSGIEETVEIQADEFIDGQAELPSPAYAGTVSVVDSDGNALLEDDFQVDGRILTINSLRGSEPVGVSYAADMSMTILSSEFMDDDAVLPFEPSGSVTVTLDGDPVAATVDGTTLHIEGASIAEDAVFTASYTKDVSLTIEFDDGSALLPDDPETVNLYGITLSDDSDPVRTAITGFELDGYSIVLSDQTQYDAYEAEYTVSETVSFNWLDTVDDEAGTINLDYQPSSVTMTKDGEAYTDFTLDGSTLHVAWVPDEELSYSVEYQANVELELSTSDFSNGSVALPYPPAGSVDTDIDGEAVANELDGYMLGIPSLVSQITSYTVTYQAEVENGEVEIPTAPSVRAGETVQVSVINGIPIATSVVGEGDRQDFNIDVAYTTASSAEELAEEAKAVAEATGQHFWDDTNGAHVTEVTKEEWNDSTGQNYHSGYNSLWNSLGMLFRNALNNLVSITQSAIAFYNGLGNSGSNIVASFGSNGFQVGIAGESHLVGDYHSLQLVDREGDAYFNVSDLRDASGEATITDTFIGDGSTQTFSLGMTASNTAYTVKRNGTTVTSGIRKYATYFDFDTAPQNGATITATYTATAQDAKAYTFGTRGDGNVGGMSTAIGVGCVAGGYASYSEGSNTVASGKYSHAEGLNSTATGYCSHVEGHGTTASYGSSHAEGHNSEALSDSSHAEGNSTVASGNFAHAEGWYTEASGVGSHAQNYNTVAASDYQTAIGQYNITDSADKYAFIIGNGDVFTPSNAMTVGWDGAVAGLTFNGFRGRANLASADNIDALYTTGIYYVSGSGVGGTLPSGITAYFSLITMGGGAEESGTYVGKQMILGGSGVVWTRSYSGSPRAWSAWTQLVSSSVATHSPTLTNATAVTFETRRQGSVVNLQVYQLKVAASLAEGSSVTLGTGIIGSNARPAHNVYLQLMSNTAGKGAGCFLVVTTAGNVVLYNRSGSALGTGTNLYGNTSWVI